MQGLRIRDQIQWHGRWSAEIGRRLEILDSSNDLYIFDGRHGRNEILALLQENHVPGDLYQLFEVEEAPEEDCDIQADSGRCYRNLH